MPKGIKGFQRGHPNYLLHHSERAKRKIKENNAHYWLGKKKPPQTEEHKRKFSEATKGEKHWRWIKDRTQLCRISKQGERRTSIYLEWRRQVWKRDGFKCKIANQNCNGKIKAHHILPWRDFPELRYNINNGITLCQAHHPRKRAEEKRLIPFFQGLVPISNEHFVNTQRFISPFRA